MLLWLRVAVGIILTVSFSVPFAIIASNGSLREEPMTLLVINMTLVDFVFGVLFFATGLADVVFSAAVPAPLCASLQYLMLGCAIAGKAATLCLALDQFCAVVFSLRYCTIMSAWVDRLVALTWSCALLVALFGLVCYQLGLESSLEFNHRVLGVERHVSQCRWELNAHLFMVVVEVLLLLLSLCSGLLFVYTAVQGARHEWRHQPNNRLFLRFKSFQRIVKVLLIVIAIDVVAAGVRIGSRWTAHQEVTMFIQQLRVLCLIAEGWAYGLSYPAVRSAISSFFGGRSSRASDQAALTAVPPATVQRPVPQCFEWDERSLSEPPRF